MPDPAPAPPRPGRQDAADPIQDHPQNPEQPVRESDQGAAKPVRRRRRGRAFRRRLLHRPPVQRVLAALIAGYIRLVARTGRWQLCYDPAVAELVRRRQPFIGLFWHGRMMMIHPAWQALVAELRPADPALPHVLQSSHGDGQMMAMVMRRFGLATIWGSSRRGGMAALRAALATIQRGDILVLTPDGPRGPRQRVQPGAIAIARKSGAPIVPMTFTATHQKLLDTWDRLALVPPFARGRLVFGTPIAIAPDADLEAARAEVEARLAALTDATDRALGREPVPAA